MLSLIIINYNTAEMTEKVIRNFLQCEPDLKTEIILIDNASDGAFPIERLSDIGVRYIANKENVGFARAVNQGLALAQGEQVLLLNSDVLVKPGSISRILLELKEGVGIVGPQMVYPDGRFQSSFGPFPSLWSEFLRFSLLRKIFPGGTFADHSFFRKIDLSRAYPVDWVSGGCMLISREAIEKVGSLDGEYFLGVEDIDFCYQAKRYGLATIYCPEALVIHHHGYSSGQGGTRSVARIRRDQEGLDRFFRKNFPGRILTRWVVYLLHEGKLRILNF
jgi:GT2 family glycosyltransferase